MAKKPMPSLGGRRSSPLHQTLRRVVPQSNEELPPRPTSIGSMVLLFGLVVTAYSLNGKTASEVASSAAVGVGLSLAASVFFDLRLGLRNLIRVDLMMLVSLYFLTLFEFLFRQEGFDQMLPPSSVYGGVYVVLFGFAGLVVGRHLTSWTAGNYLEIFSRPVAPRTIIVLFWTCFLLGFMYMLMAVEFNPVTLFEQMLRPRFTQPWQRGRFGDWRALFSELQLLTNVVPAIAGVVIARPSRYTKSQMAGVLLGLGFTLFYGFSTGTRNVLASYLATFVIAYALSIPRQATRRLVGLLVVVAVVFFISSQLMLQFRQEGLGRFDLAAYFSGEYKPFAKTEETFFVDYNLYVISCLTEVFPHRFSYLGWEVPYIAAIRPIPRVLWPGKPEGLSIGIEESLGAEGLTLAASFVGEAYMMAGWFGVFVTGVFFGLLAGWWGRLASPRNSDFGNLVYASGFFAAVISMRSIFVFTTAILPTIGAIVLGSLFLNRQDRLHRGPRRARTTAGPGREAP